MGTSVMFLHLFSEAQPDPHAERSEGVTGMEQFPEFGVPVT